MPSRRHSEAMLSSPRRPSITIRIFSSAEKHRRVFRRMSRTAYSADAFFAMDSFSSRSREPSLRSSLHSVQTRLTAYNREPLARKLAIALWRYLETGLIPEGAILKAK